MRHVIFRFLTVMFVGILMPENGMAQKVVNDLNAYMKQIRTLKYESVPTNFLEIDKKEKEFIAALVPYLKDTTESVKERAYYILKQVGLRSKDQNIRQDVVSLLTEGIRDKSTAISGNSSAALSFFNRNDFTETVKDSIVNSMVTTTSHLDQVIKLAGYLGLRKSLEKLSQFSTSSKISLRWASIIARARMNDRDAIDSILGKLSSVSVNDDFVYDIVPDLIYTRQKEIFSFLDQIILSDKPSCESANPDASEKILCGYRVMEYMAPVVAGFPLKIDASGLLLENDYKRGFEKFREWLNQNRQYQIIDNAF